MRAQTRRGLKSWLFAVTPLTLSAALFSAQVNAAPGNVQSKTKVSAGAPQEQTPVQKAAKSVTTAKARPASVKAKAAGTKRAKTTKRLQIGKASWYGPGFHGRKTANGERFNMYELTAAHRTLPLGTRVRVVNPDNGKEVVVRINDRGPYAHGRILDLSKAAAGKLGLITKGHGEVELHALNDDSGAGQGLSARRVAARDPEQSPARQVQEQVLAQTRFGQSKQVLGTDETLLSGDDSSTVASASTTPVALRGAGKGLMPIPSGLGFDATRSGSTGLPWGQSEWDAVQFAPVWQARNGEGLSQAAAPHVPQLDMAAAGEGPVNAEEPAAVVVGASFVSATATATAASAGVVGSGWGEGAAPLPTGSRLTVPSQQLVPVAHVPRAAASGPEDLEDAGSSSAEH